MVSNIETPLGEAFYEIINGNLISFSFQKPEKISFTTTEQCRVTEAKLKQEIHFYFEGKLKQFSIPLEISGTEFQKTVWNEINEIAFGDTLSYLQLAMKLNKINASRAVGNATGNNKILLIIPCHRLVGASGKLTGYAGGVKRKVFLLNHEAYYSGKSLF